MPGQSCSARSASASISALWDSFPPVAGVLHTLQRRLAAAHQLAQKLSSGPLNNKERAHGVTFSASRSASPASRSASPASRSASPASRSASRLQLAQNWSTIWSTIGPQSVHKECILEPPGSISAKQPHCSAASPKMKKNWSTAACGAASGAA